MNDGLDQLVRLAAAAQPLAPACDHFYFLRHGQTEATRSASSRPSTSR